MRIAVEIRSQLGSSVNMGLCYSVWMVWDAIQCNLEETDVGRVSELETQSRLRMVKATGCSYENTVDVLNLLA